MEDSRNATVSSLYEQHNLFHFFLYWCRIAQLLFVVSGLSILSSVLWLLL